MSASGPMGADFGDVHSPVVIPEPLAMAEAGSAGMVTSASFLHLIFSLVANTWDRNIGSRRTEQTRNIFQSVHVYS